MNVEIEVRNRLAADAAVSALVSDRIYQLILDQDATLPAIRVQLIDEPTRPHLRGPGGLTRARVQVDAFTDDETSADAYETATEIADAVDDALFGAWHVGSPPERRIYFAMRDDRRPMYEEGELKQVRIQSDYFVWSRAA